MASQFGLWLTGSVEWAGVPLAGVRIQLKAPGDYSERPVVAETATRPDGWYEFKNPPMGDWHLYAVSPSAEYWSYPARPITVAAGQWVDGGQFIICKHLELIEPLPDAELTTLSPVLRWASFPDAAVYHMDIYNKASGETLRSQETPNTHVVVDPALAPGVLYMWWVYAFDSADHILAYSASPNFTVRA